MTSQHREASVSTVGPGDSSKAWASKLKSAPLTAQIGIVVIFAYVFIAIFAPLLAPYGEGQIVGPTFEPWGDGFVLGTDNLGRDMLTRLLYGARNTVGVAFAASLLAFIIGGTLGIFAASVGGWSDQILARLMDLLMAIPQLIFAMFLLSIFGMSIPVLIAVIAILDAARVFRLSRALGMNIAVMDYVEAAKLRGEKNWWIMRREILPNIMAPLAAEFGLRFCFVFLLISALSFLGLGIQPPMADWGSMVRDNATLIMYGDVTPLLPAAAIAILTVAVNYTVDWFLDISSGLRDD